MNSKQEYLIKKLKEAVEHDEYSNAVAYYDKALSFGSCNELDALHDVINICRKKSKEEKHLQDTYESAISLMRKNDEDSLNSAIKKFESLASYKDSEQLLSESKKLLEDFLDIQRATQRKVKIFTSIGLSVFAVVIAIVLVITNVIIPKNNYTKALDLMELKQYDECVLLFEKLGDYKDSNTHLEFCKLKIADKQYDTAISYINQKEYILAYEILSTLNHKDSFEKAESIKKNAEIQKMISYSSVGDSITFGKYEQDGNKENGKEDIVWKVVKKEKNKMMVISDKILAYEPYNNTEDVVTWETCSMRKWLNNEFFASAFSTEEQLLIPTVDVVNPRSPRYGTSGGNNTKDKVFLLSISEAESLPTNILISKPSKSAFSTDFWALRSPITKEDIWYDDYFSGTAYYGASVSPEGEISESVNACRLDYSLNNGVRPAIWIAVQ